MHPPSAVDVLLSDKDLPHLCGLLVPLQVCLWVTHLQPLWFFAVLGKGFLAPKNKLRMMFLAPNLAFIWAAHKQGYFDQHCFSDHIQSCHRILDPIVHNLGKKAEF